MRYLFTILVFISFSVVHSIAQESIPHKTQEHWVFDAQLHYTQGLEQQRTNFGMREFPNSLPGVQLKGSLVMDQIVSFIFSLGVSSSLYPDNNRPWPCGIGIISSTNPLDPWYRSFPIREQFLAFPALVGMNFSVFTFFSVGLELGANIRTHSETTRYYYFRSNAKITPDENGEFTQDRSITRLLSPEFLFAPNIQFRYLLVDKLYCTGGVRYFVLQNRLNAGIGVGLEF